jgi:predicted dithiol-disulfide oxidoreductase (DUF899 family)
MTKSTIPHPPIVSRDQWLAERKKLLAHEKELTKHYDRVNAERRRPPMVKIEKDYVFDGPNGKPSLKDLFEGRRQLVVYHFMFDPAWDKGCSGCTSFVDALGDLSLLKNRDTTFSTRTRHTRAEPNRSRTPTASSTRHPMVGSRTLRTRPPVGLRSRPTDRLRQA